MPLTSLAQEDIAMVIPKLIGLYWPLPVVKKEAEDYLAFVKQKGAEFKEEGEKFCIKESIAE